MASNMGAPTKLTPELVERAEQYVIDGFLDAGEMVPSVAGLACYLGISKNSVYKYGEVDSDFLNTLEIIEVKQEKMLLNGGLSSTYNPTITKLMMSNHGYRESSKTELMGKNGGPIEHSVEAKPKLTPEELSKLTAQELSRLAINGEI